MIIKPDAIFDVATILTTTGDIIYASAANTPARLAVGAAGTVLVGGTTPSWSATPTLTNLTAPTIYGGAAANDDVTIEGTSHATKTTSYVVLQPTGGNVGIGTVSPDRLLHPELADAVTNVVSYPLRLTHITSGTPANSIGVGFEFEQETAADNNEVIATIEAVVTDVTATSEDADLVFKAMAAGAAAAEAMRITSTGSVIVGGATSVGTRRATIQSDLAKTDATARALLSLKSSEVFGSTNPNVFEVTVTGAASQANRIWDVQTAESGVANGGILRLQNAAGAVQIGGATATVGFYGVTAIAQGASVADATGGATVDAEARTAINALISRIEATGLIATV